MGTIKCLIVDDEELARKLLISYIDRIDFLELVDAVEGPLEAMQVMKKSPIDLLFLDIQMPDLKGTEFAKMIDSSTKIVFTTAYSEYALKGYELNALDYLLKPITFERFLMAVNKVKTTRNPIEISDSITVKSGYDFHKIKFDDLLFMVSDSEYVVFHTSERKIMSHQSLTSLEKKLPNKTFIRVHRSYIVNMDKVNTLKGKDLIIGDTKIPVSASYYELVKNKLF